MSEFRVPLAVRIRKRRIAETRSAAMKYCVNREHGYQACAGREARTKAPGPWNSCSGFSKN